MRKNREAKMQDAPSRKVKESPICYIIVGLVALSCFLPLWIAFVASVSDEAAVIEKGFSLWPRNFTLDTYKYILENKGVMLLRAYGMSFSATIIGTVYSTAVMSLFAYATAQKKENFRFAGALSFFGWFTMIFSGGLLPWYILCTKYYGLQNNIWALVLPYGMNVFYMFVLKSNFKAIPEELVEAAKIDGASDARVFFSIALPFSIGSSRSSQGLPAKDAFSLPKSRSKISSKALFRISGTPGRSAATFEKEASSRQSWAIPISWPSSAPR